MKNNKGITLIALVITIIVLLILAGVTINMVLGDNGIIRQAQVGTEKYNEQAMKENVELAIGTYTTQMYTENPRIFAEVLKTELETNGNEANITESNGTYGLTYGGYTFTINNEYKITNTALATQTPVPTPTTIYFHIEDKMDSCQTYYYKAQSNMTWEQFINSDLNVPYTDEECTTVEEVLVNAEIVVIDNNGYIYNYYDQSFVEDSNGNRVSKDDIINSGKYISPA